jgi:hypothetical protein
MTEDQRFVPDSFLALHRDARQRLSLPWEELVARHEWCEDFCQASDDQVRWLLTEHGLTPDELAASVVERVPAPDWLNDAERGWVSSRLAELLERPPGR